MRSLNQARCREARLVIQSGPVYMLAIARRGVTRIEQEAIASAALPPTHKLSSERAQLLREMGFGKQGGGRRNWRREHGRDEISVERGAVEIVDVLTRVYGIEEHAEVRIELIEDDTDHPENPELIAAMRKVAKGWDESIRRAMYTELLNATFLVPLEPDAGDEIEDSDAFLDLETHEPSSSASARSGTGRPTLAAFSDWRSLRLWEPRGWPYVPVHGSDLFELAHERNPVSFRINPNGDIGGELYGHEVEMLVRAVRSFRARHAN